MSNWKQQVQAFCLHFCFTVTARPEVAARGCRKVGQKDSPFTALTRTSSTHYPFFQAVEMTLRQRP